MRESGTALRQIRRAHSPTNGGILPTLRIETRPTLAKWPLAALGVLAISSVALPAEAQLIDRNLAPNTLFCPVERSSTAAA